MSPNETDTVKLPLPTIVRAMSNAELRGHFATLWKSQRLGHKTGSSNYDTTGMEQMKGISSLFHDSGLRKLSQDKTIFWGSHQVENVLNKYFHKRDMIANAAQNDAISEDAISEDHVTQPRKQKRKPCKLNVDYSHTLGNKLTKQEKSWGGNGHVDVHLPLFPHTAANHVRETSRFIQHPSCHTINAVDNHDMEVVHVSHHSWPVNSEQHDGDHELPVSSWNATKHEYTVDYDTKVALQQYQLSSLAMAKQQPVRNASDTWATNHPYMTVEECNVSGQQVQRIKIPCLSPKKIHRSDSMAWTGSARPVLKQENGKPIGNGIQISTRTCICAKSKCLSLVKRWAALGDKVYAGYQKIRIFKKQKTVATQIQMRFQVLVTEFLNPNAVVDDANSRPESRNYQYVANHHFERICLKGLTTSSGDSYLVPMLLNKADFDRQNLDDSAKSTFLFEKGINTQEYGFAVPCRKFQEIIEELCTLETRKFGKIQTKAICDGQRKRLEVSVETPTMIDSKDETLTTSKSHVASTFRMELDPSELKKEYFRMERELISCKAIMRRMGDELIELRCRFIDTKSDLRAGATTMLSPSLMIPSLPMSPPMMMMANAPSQMVHNSLGPPVMSFPPSLMIPGPQPLLMRSQPSLVQGSYAPSIRKMFPPKLPMVPVPPMLIARPWPMQNTLIGEDRIAPNGKCSTLPSSMLPS